MDLEQPLPRGWTQQKSKTGSTYYLHAETKATQWEVPEDHAVGAWETPSSATQCRADCLMQSDLCSRASALLWFKQRVCEELGAGAIDRIVVDLGCGACEATRALAARASEFWGWDKSAAALAAAHEALLPCLRQVHMDFCAAGEILPKGTPTAGTCSLVTCVDAAQYAFVSAASARRWARRVRALLAPSGYAVVVLPNAADIVHKTACGCIEHVLRGHEVLRTEGASWPSSILDVPVYGARYSQSARRSAQSQVAWLVSAPTLQHACSAVGLKVDAQCTASAFLRWCGMGRAVSPKDAEAFARRERTYASLGALQLGELSAAAWDELNMWSVCVLVPQEAAKQPNARLWHDIRETYVADPPTIT